MVEGTPTGSLKPNVPPNVLYPPISLVKLEFLQPVLEWVAVDDVVIAVDVVLDNPGHRREFVTGPVSVGGRYHFWIFRVSLEERQEFVLQFLWIFHGGVPLCVGSWREMWRTRHRRRD